jgi:nicotinate-nucleotide pyrophosphorylase (carboxylating)
LYTSPPLRGILYLVNWDSPQITHLLRAALAEDLGTPPRDVTAEATVAAAARAGARILARQDLVLAGMPLVTRLFASVDPELQCTPHASDGTLLRSGDAVLRLQGNARAILAAERTALNFLARLSGIATLTRRFVEAIAGTRARIRDTRKTTPLHRELEKYAVRTGGGSNHRFGLYDAILIKENHIAQAGGAAAALQAAHGHATPGGPPLAIQIEVCSEADLRAVLAAGAESVLLDNQSPADAARMVALVRAQSPHCVVELSGGITLANVRAFAETGADFLAIGALTHSAPAADLSLLFDMPERS